MESKPKYPALKSTPLLHPNSCYISTKRIENQLEHNHNEFKKDHGILSNKVDRNHNEAIIAHNDSIVMLKFICERLKITHDQLHQNNEATQHQDPLDTSNSSDSHHTPKSPKTSSMHNQKNSNTSFQNM